MGARFGIVLTVSLLASATAVAQDAAERDQARAHFARGVAAAESGEWNVARDSFQAAYDLVELPAILLNLAGAKRQTGDLAGAREGYQGYLQSPDDEESRAAAQQELEEIERELAELEVVRRVREPVPEAVAPSVAAEVTPQASLLAPNEVPRATPILLPSEDDSGETVFSSPWFWLVAGVVVAAGVVTAILLVSPADPSPFSGNFGNGTLEVP